MNEIEVEIKAINLKINEIEYLLDKDFEEWTLKEKQKFGNHRQLRQEKRQLRDEEKKLMKEKEQLRDLLILKKKEKQGTASIAAYNMKVEITCSEFLDYIPPKIEFSHSTRAKLRQSESSGPRAHPKEPANVAPWDDFLSNAASFRLESSSALISPPAFKNYATKVSDESDLRGVIHANIIDPINYLLILTGSQLLFTGPSQVDKPILKGWPDHILHENHELMSFIETKTIWDLPTPLNNETIIQWWKEDVLAENSESIRQNPRPSIFHIIGQVYGYQSNHELKYGMLINGEVAWFLCRPNLPNDPTTLFISPPISLVGKSPTFFQSIMYFISLIIDGHKSGKSPKTSPTGVSFPMVPIVSGRNVPDVPADLNLSQLNELIGDGFCGNVFKYTMQDGTEIALKCCDKMNNYDGYKMMKNEIKIYQKLKRLQGTLIPRLRFSGYSGEIFLIGTDYIKGKHPDLTKDMVEKLKLKLARYRIDHGDLRKQNIIEDESGNYWVIDFGKSKIIK